MTQQGELYENKIKMFDFFYFSGIKYMHTGLCMTLTPTIYFCGAHKAKPIKWMDDMVFYQREAHGQ